MVPTSTSLRSTPRIPLHERNVDRKERADGDPASPWPARRSPATAESAAPTPATERRGSLAASGRARVRRRAIATSEPTTSARPSAIAKPSATRSMLAPRSPPQQPRLREIDSSRTTSRGRGELIRFDGAARRCRPPRGEQGERDDEPTHAARSSPAGIDQRAQRDVEVRVGLRQLVAGGSAARRRRSLVIVVAGVPSPGYVVRSRS